jgi:hypothetical protein
VANFRTLEVQVSDESSFAEAVRTYAVRLPVRDCKPSLVEERFDDTSYQARQNHGQGGFRGPRRADLDLSMVLGGHGTTCAGALTETALQQLLGDGLGGNNVAAQGTTVKTAGTASSFTLLNASTGLAVGQVIRVGVAGDGRGGGQPGVIATLPGADVVTLLEALPAAPQADDVVYATQIAYPVETLAGPSKRFLVGHAETNNQQHIVGAELAGLAIAFPFGALPTVDLKYMAADWAEAAFTVPSAVSLSANDAAPVAGGSLHIQTVGTATRAAFSVWDVKLDIDLGLVENKSPGGLNAYQNVTSHSRTKCVPTLTITGSWSSLSALVAALWDGDGSSSVYKDVLFAANPTNGRAVGFHCPSMAAVGPRPTVGEFNEQTALTITMRGREGPTTTNDLTRAAVKIWMG